MRNSGWIPFLGVLATSWASASTNLPIDLSMPAPVQPVTDGVVYGESKIFAPNFGVNQNDPALSDLFDPKTKSSNLCFPTTLAETLIYLSTYQTPAFGSLALNGLSADRKTIEPNTLIRQLAAACKTDAATGTLSVDAFNCVVSMLSQSGYGLGKTKMVSPFDKSATLPIDSRPVTIQDIRDALKAGDPVILEAAWFKFDPITRAWVRDSGHYVGVYGYDYNPSWGNDRIQVKVLNPEMNYGTSRMAPFFDTVTIERVTPQPGITYPPNRPYFLSGNGFGGTTQRGFLGLMIRVSPATN